MSLYLGLLFLLWTALTPEAVEILTSCTPQPFLRIGFHLQISVTQTSNLDQGVRLEYEDIEDVGWQPLRYYTSSLHQIANSSVTINDDNISVTAMGLYSSISLPLHVVNSSGAVFYQEYLFGNRSIPSRMKIRWAQRYLSADQHPDIAPWSIDNVTVIQWDGQCRKTLVSENFENSTCISSGDYTIRNAAQTCRSSDTKQLYFNGSIDLRRYLAIKNISSTQAECDGMYSHGSGEYPTCENTSLLGSICPNGYQLNLSSVACIDINECDENKHNCNSPMKCSNTLGGFECVCSIGYALDEDRTSCSLIPNDKSQNNHSLVVNCLNQADCGGESYSLTIQQCCLESSDGRSFTVPGLDECYACIVYGWLSDNYTGGERYQSHVLNIGFRKGSEYANMSTGLLFNIISIDGNGLGGAVSTTDFEVFTKVATLNEFVLVSFIEDMVALEYNETFNLILVHQPSTTLSGINVLFCDTIELTITDSDTLDVYFTEDEFRASEPELKIPVSIGKSKRTASPLILKLLPHSITDIISDGNITQPVCPNMCSCVCEIGTSFFGESDNMVLLSQRLPHENPASPIAATMNLDFSGEVVLVTFEPDEKSASSKNEVTTSINITDDNINEAEQIFLLEINIEQSLSFPLLRRPTTLCKIIDNDALRIGFPKTVFEFSESGNHTDLEVEVLLVKENNVESEQTFSIELLLLEPAISDIPAIQATNSGMLGGDFAFPNEAGSLILHFTPSSQMLRANLTIFDDNIAEGTETFMLHSRSYTNEGSPSYYFPIDTFTDTRIIIFDDDNIIIGFEMDYTTVSEASGVIVVCLKYYNSPSTEEKKLGTSRYEIKVDYQSMNISASTGADYLSIPPSFIVLNDSYYFTCLNISIVDDLVIENTESFSVNITNYELLPSSSDKKVILEPAFIMITIEDDDAATIGFSKNEYIISEGSPSEAIITLQASGADFGQPIIVSISTHDISAQEGIDYDPIIDKWLTFNDNISEVDIAVNIKNDFLFEHDEILGVSMKLVSESFVELELQDNTTIVIIDNDGVTASLNEMIVVNHDLLYFDEIGVNISTGLICNGVASDICCGDDDPVRDGAEDGREPNGLGSWIYPDGSYVRYDCNRCIDVEEDTFQVHRTENTTILYRNEDATMKLVNGIYRCDIPLNTSAEDVLTQYVGIYERRMGDSILLRKIELTVITTIPASFQLNCVTSGGPLANTYWTRDGGNNRIGTNNETFHASLVVVDFIEAVYSHTLIVNGSFPGVYAFFAQDPFSDGVQFISVTRNVEDICSGNSECEDNVTLSCDDGFQYNSTGNCVDIDECESNLLNNCSSLANSQCLNSIGSYICQCAQDFVSFPDGSCRLSVIALSSITGSIGLILLLALGMITSTAFYLHIKKKRMKNKIDEPSSISEEKHLESVSDTLRNDFIVNDSLCANLPRELFILANNLELGEPIGQGEFGIVYKAQYVKDFGQRITNIVAVKTLKGFQNENLVRDMLRECVKMIQFDHPNVLALIGVCLDGGPAPYIVMPFMSNGSLLSYLKKFRKELLIPNDHPNQDEVEVTLMKLMDMCIQVAKGMEYLAGKKLIHRDLAARNCMIDMNYVIKVADFGLSVTLESHDYFRQDSNNAVKLPIKWLAIESLNDSIFSEKSDVWAFGVTCWEIFNGGKTPHATINPMNILTLLEDGYRLEKPVNLACSDEMYSIMLKCWTSTPKKRPTFSQLVDILSLSLATKAGYLDINTFNENSLTKSEDIKSPSAGHLLTEGTSSASKLENSMAE